VTTAPGHALAVREEGVDRASSEQPALGIVAELLRWRPAQVPLRAWRDAFDDHLEQRASSVFTRSEANRCLGQSLSLLPAGARRRFLRAPAVSTLLGGPPGGPFDARHFAGLLFAELAAAGVAADLPASCWSARGDRFLDRSAPQRWTSHGATLGDTGIAVDEESSFRFPDDEFGLTATRPHGRRELELAVKRVLAATASLGRGSPPALAFVTTFIEVLALRREPQPVSFHSSTFPGFAGLVRFTNAHLADVDTPVLMEALVHESIHGILHFHEEFDGHFVRPMQETCKVVSPWTGAAIGLRSYVHACAVWYGIHELWSLEAFTEGEDHERARTLRQRARAGFEHRPVSVSLAPFDHLLTTAIKRLLLELEDRMLSNGCAH
jgi:hypothetical protein